MAGRTRPLLLTGTLLAGWLLVGCASFPDSGPRDWRDKPEFDVEAGPQPQVPGGPGGPGGPGDPDQPPPAGPPPPPEGCTDFSPSVIATCLDPVSALAVLPGGIALLAAERRTGRILRVEQQGQETVVATLEVDASTGGGLTGLALSPTYFEDELVFAYITTPTDNRIVRFAPGDAPKPVLTGIPRGPTGNAGAIIADDNGALLVATGDAGNPAAAEDPASLAGKVLRIDTSGNPAAPNPGSRVVAAGLHNPGGLCLGLDGQTAWVTDRGQLRDTLYEVKPGQQLGEARWTWPDRPGVAGCFVSNNGVSVALTGAAALFRIPLAPDGSIIGKPAKLPDNNFGRLSAAAVSADRLVAWIGTANKDGDKPVSSDDRVFYLIDATAGGGGID